MQASSSGLRVIKARTRVSNVEGFEDAAKSAVVADIQQAVAAEQNRAVSVEDGLSQSLVGSNQRISNIETAMQTKPDALANYNQLLDLINSGDAIDQEAIQAITATAVRSRVERGIACVDGIIVLAQNPVNGVDSIDRLIVSIGGEDYDLLAVSASGNEIDLGDSSVNGTVVFIKYDVIAVSQSQSSSHSA